MLLKDYKLTLKMPECNPSSQIINGIANLGQNIEEVLPYLNSVIKNCFYNHKSKILSFKKDGHMVTIYPDMIAVTKFNSKEEMIKFLDWLKNFINEIYRNRENIKPNYKTREIPKPIELLKLLPGENCGDCGYASCLAFAVKLSQGEATIEDCPLIFKAEFKEKKEKLSEVFLEA